MSIKREELSVSTKYFRDENDNVICKVLFIGEGKLFARMDNGYEKIFEIEDFVQNFSLPPKPKEKITIVEYCNGTGHIYKVTDRTFREINSPNLKIIRQYEVEVE